MLLRFLIWRLAELLACAFAIAVGSWWLEGGPRMLLTGQRNLPSSVWAALAREPTRVAGALAPALPLALALGALAAAGTLALLLSRWRARARRRYVRLRVVPYRTDQATPEAVVAMFESLHKCLLQRWWERLARGQASLAVEVHRARGGSGEVGLAICCPAEARSLVQTAVRGAYPSAVLRPEPLTPGSPPALLRLRKRYEFIRPVKALDRFELEREPPINRLMRALASCPDPAYVQLALTPAPLLCARYARAAYRHHERRLARTHLPFSQVRPRSILDAEELRGALALLHSGLFFADLRVAAADRGQARRIAAQLREQSAENELVPRELLLRGRLLSTLDRRLARGEGNPIASPHSGLWAAPELAGLWHLPSVAYAGAPFARGSVPFAPAPPAILRPAGGEGILRDVLGPVSIHEGLRRQNTAVPGAVEQGKSSFLVASFAEDLRRTRCAVILLDPKGDAADAALSAVPPERACTLLDLSHPTCGFNPLAMAAPADVVADHVVGALRNLFTEADIRASSDRYLRNAVIAVLASDPSATLWDAARLLSVGGEGYEYRARVGAMVRGMPAFKEISEFFTAELAAQLNDARSMTTAKLDAPVNKLARLLNSPSIKRVLLNESLRVDLDRVISGCEVLVVKGALGAMGAGNTSVLMQMLMGMLDAALARQQDSVPGADRVAVALKVDEAPLVINRGFAETLALKRSAGLETTACWQTDSQWTDREVRAQLDALFAHRVYFATASVQDARASAALLMAEFADSVRPGNATLSTLGRPDARLHLPKHHAIASFTAPDGRQSPFVAETLPMRVDPARIELHARRQAERGGRYLADLRQPHWERARSGPARSRAPAPVAAQASETIDGPPVGDGSPPDAPAQTGETPAEVGEGYRELVDLDRSPTVRVVPGDPAAGSLTPDEIDLEILRLLDSFRFALTSQIHRRFNAGRAVSTTQRRLKRLSDAGLIARLQFHRRDGAGVPMCCAITASGELALARAGAAPRASTRAAPGRPVRGAPGGGARPGARPDLGVLDDPRELAQVRHDIHVLGWALALERALGPGRLRLAGARDSVIAPPSRRTSTGERTVGPRDLRLPGGRTPHGFLRTGPAGEQLEVTRFQSLRPDATVTLARPPAAGPPAEPGGASGLLDVLVERDDRPAGAGGRAKLERYDHFLAGWAMLTRRHGPVAGTLPLVVFICRDRARARECARQADGSLHACQAYAGEYPSEWLYPGRPQILFCAERDVHAGNLLAYGVPALPPPERAERAGGVPGLRAAAAEQRTLLPAH